MHTLHTYYYRDGRERALYTQCSRTSKTLCRDSFALARFLSLSLSEMHVHTVCSARWLLGNARATFLEAAAAATAAAVATRARC